MRNEDLEKVLKLIYNSTAQYFNCRHEIHIEKSNESFLNFIFKLKLQD